MKIFVIHGDNVTQSYQRLQEYIKKARTKGWEIERIQDKSKNISDVLASASLFSNNRLVVIEDASFVSKSQIEWFKKNSDKVFENILLYNESALSATFLKSLPKPDKVEEFKLPVLVWKFLDSLYPGNSKNSLLLLHEILKTQPDGFIFALISKHVRDLYWAKVDSSSMLYPSWRVGKLRTQAARFPDKKLEDFIEKLAEIDLAVKTSQKELKDSLDFVIVTLLS